MVYKTKNKIMFRSRNRIIGGVCGGIAEAWGINPIIIRTLWVALSLLYGTGLLIYAICWIAIPSE
ncbi:PspC domain-containing protein [Candidatus Gracilibacteria bacterium]|nr:PspC domain-containing protein [Candidatus Gracilibacteria bacterium]